MSSTCALSKLKNLRCQQRLPATYWIYSRYRSSSATYPLYRTDLPDSVSVKTITFESLPGPRSLPFIGAGYKFAFNRNVRSRMHLMQLDLVKEYGTVFKMALGPQRGLAVACPELMKEIVKHEDPIPVRKEPLPWAEYLNTTGQPPALLTSQRQDWERKRKTVQGLMLKSTSMEHFTPSLDGISSSLLEVLARNRDSSGYVPNLPMEIYHWAFEGIVSVLFGTRAGCLEAVVNHQVQLFISSLNNILDACFNSLMVFAPIHRKFNTRLWIRHKQAWDIINQSVEFHIEKMMDQMNNISHPPLLMSMMANNKLANEEIRSMVAEFFMGGVDTTSNSVGFALYNLACHPDKQEKLRQEINMVLGDNPVTLNRIQQMTYLRNCIKETLRLYPILFINGRTIKQDFVSQSRNIQFKKNDNILFFHYAMSHSEDLWDRPAEFVPERFDRSHSSSTSPERNVISIPFGFGTRSCIGKRIAEAEMSILLVKILQRFELQVDKRWPFEPIARSVLTPGEKIPIQFLDRKL